MPKHDSVSWKDYPFSILFQNDDLLAVDKPEGLASIPEGAPGREDLLSILSARYPGKLYVVHRLDKEVSGVILFARNAAAHRHLNEQFSQRSAEKRYLALVHGLVTQDEGLIEAPIREFGSGRMGVDTERGKPSLTRFVVLRRFGRFTLLHVYPLTGRRHQIRVHLYHIGHPIVGDLRYGDREVQRAFPRLMLHTAAITFRLPNGERMTISSPMPDSFRRALKEATGSAFEEPGP